MNVYRYPLQVTPVLKKVSLTKTTVNRKRFTYVNKVNNTKLYKILKEQLNHPLLSLG